MNVMLDAGAKMPTRAHESDAGYDLYTPIPFTLFGGGSIVIDTGVHVEIPHGYVGMIKSKSGLNVNKSIVTEGVIDSGYTGSIRVKLYSNADDNVLYDTHFEAGDKIAQLVLLPIFTPDLECVEKLEATERGANGFGSTGR